MIGVFDSGHGGLTVFRALVQRFPDTAFIYLGDHANAPYGNRPSEEVVDLTQRGVELLFQRGARLVLLGCNTATCVAARTLQQDWLPSSGWTGRNVLGIVAPTVEAATQTPWAVTSPQYPQKNNTDVIGIFGTTRTIASYVYVEEIRKRCPRATVVQQICPDLAGAIEQGRPETELERQVIAGVAGMLGQTGGVPPHQAVLGCTHFPLVEHLFRRHLPGVTRIRSQPEATADSLEDYLHRRPHYRGPPRQEPAVLLTTGDPKAIGGTARLFWPAVPDFTAASFA
jgi:glutamate racemase